MLLRWFLVNGTPNERMFNQSKIRERIALERSKIERLFYQFFYYLKVVQFTIFTISRLWTDRNFPSMRR